MEPVTYREMKQLIEIGRLREWQRARLEQHDQMNAEIERLRAQLVAAEEARLNDINAMGMMEVRAGAAEAQLASARKALEEVDGCFQAAYAEGLSERLAEADQDTGTLADLFYRRVVFAHHAAISALTS